MKQNKTAIRFIKENDLFDWKVGDIREVDGGDEVEVTFPKSSTPKVVWYMGARVLVDSGYAEWAVGEIYHGEDNWKLIINIQGEEPKVFSGGGNVKAMFEDGILLKAIASALGETADDEPQYTKEQMREAIEEAMELGYEQVWGETEQKSVAEKWRRDFCRYALPELFKKYNIA